MDSTPIVVLPEGTFLPAFLGADMATLIFYLVLGFYAIFTGVLYYHWNAYASDKRVAFATYIAYASITIPLMLVMASTTLII